MKPVKLDFVERPAQLGLANMILALAATFCVWGLWQAYLNHQLKKQYETSMQVLRQQLTELQATKPRLNETQKDLDPNFVRQASIAAKALSFDLNKALSPIENLRIPGVRLLGLSINSANNSVEVEYEISALEQAVEIGEALQAGRGTSPWILQSATRQSRDQNSAESKDGALALIYLVRWSAKLDQL